MDCPRQACRCKMSQYGTLRRHVAAQLGSPSAFQRLGPHFSGALLMELELQNLRRAGAAVCSTGSALIKQQCRSCSVQNMSEMVLQTFPVHFEYRSTHLMAYCRVFRVSSVDVGSGVIHAIMQVWALPPMESCRRVTWHQVRSCSPAGGQRMTLKAWLAVLSQA